MSTFKTGLKFQVFTLVTLLGVPMATAFLMWIADGSQRTGFNDAAIVSVRYIASVLVMMVLMVPVFWAAGRRPPGTPLTWGEAMVAATYVFFIFFWIYGVVPHEFLNWADAELGWRPDIKIIGPGATWTWWSFWDKVPITISKQIIRDLIAVWIYVVGLGANIWAWAWWNDRAKKAAEAEAVVPTSRYGRPLVTKAGA